MSAKHPRPLLRWLHLLGAAAIGTYVYAPWKDSFWFTLLMQLIVLPGLALTGGWLWLGPQLRKRFVGKTARPMAQQHP